MARSLVNLRWRLGALCLCTGVAAAAAELSAEEKLQAVRQELLQAALQGATQVRSTAWIDASGALRESSSFRHGLQVRGVRVLSYHRDEAGQPAAKVQWQSGQDLYRPPGGAPVPAAAGGKPASGAAQAGDAAPACDGASGLRHVLGWNLSLPSRVGVDEHHLLREAGELLTRRWHQRAESAGRWRTLELPPPSELQASGYLRLLTAGPAAARPAWTASVRIEHVQLPSPAPVWVPGQQPAEPLPGRLRLVFSLSQGEGGPVRLHDSQELPLATAMPTWGPLRLEPASADALRQQLDRWARQVDELLACQAPQVQVLQAQADRVQVDQGALAGLQPGQEWLISDRRKAAQVLEPGAAEAMVLARIERVDAQRAELRVLAGPREQIRPRWQAWPMSAP